MAKAPARGKNEPPAPIIVVKKIIDGGHGGHHGGAWKVAYADFVTAMMAFFLLLWILGATDEKQRKGIADYFTPTLVEMRQKSAGSNGPFGGDSIVSAENYAHRASQTGSRSITIPKDATGGSKEGEAAARKQDRTRFMEAKAKLEARMKADPKLSRYLKNIRFTETREGLRIDIVDESDFSMFASGTNVLLPGAQTLMDEVAKLIETLPNGVIVRGHTDALPYAAGRDVNNWTLSASRAEATRRILALDGVPNPRFSRIEGVADREPYVPADRYDPRNRRMSITLSWSMPGETEGATVDSVRAADAAERKGAHD